MAHSLNFIATILLGLLLLQGALSQKATIISPAAGATITPGQQLTVVLRETAAPNSVNHLAFSTGFRSTKVNDQTSLGRPYAQTVTVGSGAFFDSTKTTWTYTITVPKASAFLDGFGSYQLTVNQYYLQGSYYNPSMQLVTTNVNVAN